MKCPECGKGQLFVNHVEEHGFMYECDSCHEIFMMIYGDDGEDPFPGPSLTYITKPKERF